MKLKIRFSGYLKSLNFRGFEISRDFNFANFGNGGFLSNFEGLNFTLLPGTEIGRPLTIASKFIIISNSYNIPL